MKEKHGMNDVVSKSNCSSLLIELDIGLRSESLGQQSKIIARFPTLFEHNPMPLFVNTGFLKIAEVFYKGPNLIRYFVMNAVRDCEIHLYKIGNIDEFITPIFNVLHSNDPNARTMSLKTIGYAASILYDRSNVRDGLINGLDSRNEKEVEAAIWASQAFARRSSFFAANFFKKVCRALMSPATSVDMHAKLLKVVCHVKSNGDEVSSRAVRNFLVKQMKSNEPSKVLYIAYLTTLTKLSLNSITHITEQVELLILALDGDYRKCIKLCCIQLISSLIPDGQHLFTRLQCRKLYHLLHKFQDEDILVGILNILLQLVNSIACKYIASTQVEVHKAYLLSLHCNSSGKVASLAPLFFASTLQRGRSIVDQPQAQALATMAKPVRSAVVFNLFQCASTNCLFSQVDAVCKSCIEIVKYDPSMTLYVVHNIINACKSANVEVLNVYCNLISSILSIRNVNVFEDVSNIEDSIRDFIENNEHPTSISQKNLLIVLMQTQIFCDTIDKKKMHFMIKKSSNILPWHLYLLSRAATRYAQYYVCLPIFKYLIKMVHTTEHHYHLQCLHTISLAEFKCCTCNPLISEFTERLRFRINKLEEGIYIYEQCLPLFQVGSKKTLVDSFQKRYVEIRIHLLDAFLKTLNTCIYYRLHPPSKSSEVIGCMEKQVFIKFVECIKCFEKISEEYSDLYRSCFDSDDTTLNIINVVQSISNLMISVIRMFTKPKIYSDDICIPENLMTVPLELVCLKNKFLKVVELANSDKIQLSHNKLPYQHIVAIGDCVMHLTSTPLPLPRFYFQRSQTTVVTLSVSDNSSSTATSNASANKTPFSTSSSFTKYESQIITVSNDIMMSLCVDGDITYKTKSKNCKHRRVTSIKLNVVTEQLSNTYDQVPTKNELRITSMSKIVRVKNSSFNTQLLLSFAGTAGNHKVTISSKLCDNKENSWWDGPTSILNVRSTDEADSIRRQKEYAEQKHKERLKKI